MKKRPNIVIHMGAGVFDAQVRGADGQMIHFDIRNMEPKNQHRFRRELVKAFREARAI